jgi:hypothetical protein
MARPRLSEAQFTLFALLSVMTALCCLLGAIAGFGVWAVLGAALLVFAAVPIVGFVAIIWGAFYMLAPEATKYCTVFGLIFFVLLMPLPIALQQSREEARRLQCSRNLAQFGEQLTDKYQRGMRLEGRRHRPKASQLFDDTPELQPFVVEVARAPTPLEAQLARNRWFRDDREYPFASPLYFQP